MGVIRFLFLDDDLSRHAIFARRTGRLLGNRSHLVIQVSSAEQAIRALRDQSKFDVVFLDRDLGRPRSGESVVRELVSMPVARRPSRVVVHSRNFFRAPVMTRELRKGGYHVITAPFR